MPRKKREEFEYDYEFATFEDISSASFEEPKKRGFRDYVESVENLFLKNLGKMIKIASFVVAVAVLLVFLALGILLTMLDSFFGFIAVILFIVGIIVAAISMFIIFGLGQIVSQNEEILKRFNLKK